MLSVESSALKSAQKAKTWFAFLRPVFIVSIVIYFRESKRELYFVYL